MKNLYVNVIILLYIKNYYKIILQNYIIELINANTLISFHDNLLNNSVSVNYTNNEYFINSFEMV